MQFSRFRSRVLIPRTLRGIWLSLLVLSTVLIFVVHDEGVKLRSLYQKEISPKITDRSGALQCNFGMNIGPHALYPSQNIRGRTVTENTVRGAMIGILAGGAGTSDAPTGIFANVVSGSPTYGTLIDFSCGMRSGGSQIYSPDSVLETRGELGFAIATHESCP